MHYCKGMLESVSILFAAKCDDHNTLENLPSCCKKSQVQHCVKKEGKKCCDDEVIVLKQNITSTTPSFVKWIDAPLYISIPSSDLSAPQYISIPTCIENNSCDSGPPIYILHQSLIFYA